MSDDYRQYKEIYRDGSDGRDKKDILKNDFVSIPVYRLHPFHPYKFSFFVKKKF